MTQDDAVSAPMLGSVANYPAKPDGWIPVAERLPEEDEEGGMQNVLGYYPEYPPDIQLVWYTGDHWEDGEGSGQEMKSPTHWMPLPAPPNEFHRCGQFHYRVNE